MTFPDRSVATGQKLNGCPGDGTSCNICTGNAASWPLGGTLIFVLSRGNPAGSDPVVNGRSGPLFSKLLANSSQCIRYWVDGSIPATRKLALFCEHGTALVVLDACAPLCRNRTRRKWPPLQGGPLNKATRGCGVRFTTPGLPGLETQGRRTYFANTLG